MRVAFDARYLTRQPGGVGVYTYNLLRHLVDVDPSLELLLITRPGGTRPPLPAERFEELSFPAEPRSLRSLFDLGQRLPAGLQLYHCPFNILPLGLPCPGVVTIHDLMWLQSPLNITINPITLVGAAPLWRFGLLRAARRADRLLTVSQTTERAIAARFGPTARARTTVTPNGLDPYFREPPTRTERLAADDLVPTRHPFVLVVGNLSRHKNHLRALQAFEQAFEPRPEFLLVFVQRMRRWDPQLRLRLARSPLRRRVLQLPHLPRGTLRALYHRATALLFPSLVEGFGLPILEAMGCGCPVITADRGATAEVAGEAALIVSPTSSAQLAQALIDVEADPALRARLIRRGHERAAAFSWRRCAELTVAVYRSLG